MTMAEWPTRASTQSWIKRQMFCPPSLALVLQFYDGDQAAALELAKLLADIEAKPRDDVLLVFARRFDTPMCPEIEAAAEYCRAKFPVVHDFQSRRVATGRPDGCFGLWAGGLELLWEHYLAGDHACASAFTFEPDGVPMTKNWIWRLQEAHKETQSLGKRVTGSRTNFLLPHVNGSLIIDLAYYVNTPTLHVCPPGWCWDRFHDRELLNATGPSRIITNQYGMTEISESVFRALAHEHAWLANSKDKSAWAFVGRNR